MKKRILPHKEMKRIECASSAVRLPQRLQESHGRANHVHKNRLFVHHPSRFVQTAYASVTRTMKYHDGKHPWCWEHRVINCSARFTVLFGTIPRRTRCNALSICRSCGTPAETIVSGPLGISHWHFSPATDSGPSARECCLCERDNQTNTDANADIATQADICTKRQTYATDTSSDQGVATTVETADSCQTYNQADALTNRSKSDCCSDGSKTARS